jgi:HSP20 family protein
MANFASLIPWRDRSRDIVRHDENLDPFIALRRHVDRMFDDFFDTAFNRFPAFGNGSVNPTVDVEDTGKDLVVSAELPGLDSKDFEVTLTGDILTIKGEKKDERREKKGESHYVERRFGSFERSIRLPFEAADDKIDAKYDRGLLTIRVPKPAELAKPERRIEVKSS